MSKHNNSLSPSSHAKCRCGRMATIIEWKMGIGVFGFYECADCSFRNYSKPLTSEEYYRSMGVNITLTTEIVSVSK